MDTQNSKWADLSLKTTRPDSTEAKSRALPTLRLETTTTATTQTAASKRGRRHPGGQASEMDDDDGPANFFCRLPVSEKKVDRAASPPPLAFLQHIYANYRQLEPESGPSNGRGEASAGPSNKDLSSKADDGVYSDAARKDGRADLLSPVRGVGEGNAEEEAPWFSQLANFPQVRSAGVPLVAPGAASRSSQVPSRTKTKVMEQPPSSTSSASTSANSSRFVEHSGSTSTMQSSSSYSSIDTPGLFFSSNDTFAASSKVDGKVHSSASAPKQHSATSASTAPLVPPDNFAMVNSWVYRSSFPKKRHFPFLKTLGLKSVLTLILEEYPEQNTQFLDDNGITFFQFGIPGNKEPFVHIPPDKITAALLTILDRRNHPMLIHCNKGKHRTGCLIGCLRKLQQWSLTTIFDEYRRFSFPKSRSMDQEFIELYSESLVWLQVEKAWLPRWAVLAKGGVKSYQYNQHSVEQEEETKNHKTAAHSTLSLTVDAVNRLKMKGM